MRTKIIKRFNLLFIAAIALILNSVYVKANAQLANRDSWPMTGPYIGLQAGIGGMNTPDFSENTKTYIRTHGETYSEHNRWGLAGRLFGGYLWHTSKFQYGLELEAMKYPNNKYRFEFDLPTSPTAESYVSVNIKYEGYLVDLLGLAQYDLTPTQNVFFKGGVTYAHQKVTAIAELHNPTTGKTTSRTKEKAEDRFLPEIAVGTGYRFTPNVEANLTCNHIFGNKLELDHEDTAAKVASVNGVILGIVWLFN